MSMQEYLFMQTGHYSLHNISGIHISHKKVSLLGRGLGEEVNAKGKKQFKIILSSSELWAYLGVCT